MNEIMKTFEYEEVGDARRVADEVLDTVEEGDTFTVIIIRGRLEE